MFRFLTRLFGTQNDRAIRKLKPLVDRINSLEEEFSALSDDEIRRRVLDVRKRVTAAKEAAKAEIEEIKARIATSGDRKSVV